MPHRAREDSIFDSPTISEGGVFASSIGYSVFSQIVKLSVQIASVAILSRLLSTDGFGVVAMAAPFLLFASLLQDMGLSQVAVQRKTLTHRQASSLLWMNVGAGFIISIVLAVSSHFVGKFYQDPRVGYVLLASTPISIIGAFFSQHLALLNRSMRFQSIAAIECLSAFIGLGVAVYIAVETGSYWALYATSLATTLTTGLGSLFATRWLPSRPGVDPTFRELFSFGAGVTGFNLSNVLSRNGDNILIGKFCGSSDLGLYDRAYKLLLFPLQQINAPIQRVMTPTLSRLLDKPETYRLTYIRAVWLMSLATMPFVISMAVLADDIIPLALGEKWRNSAPIFQWLALAGALQLMNNPIGWLFVTQARGGEFARWGFIAAASCIASFAIGLSAGPIGVAAAYALSELLFRTPMIWHFAGRTGPVSSQILMRISIPVFTSAIACLAIVKVLSTYIFTTPITRLIMSPAAGYVFFIGIFSAFPECRRCIHYAISAIIDLARKPHLRGEL